MTNREILIIKIAAAIFVISAIIVCIIYGNKNREINEYKKEIQALNSKSILIVHILSL